MKKKLKINTFVEGTAIAYLAIVVTKILGALYNIPLYNIIGEEGGFIYSCAYNVYSLFLEISTSGIPIAISIVIAEYNALSRYKSKERAYKLGIYGILILSILSFLFLQIFADNIAFYFVQDSVGGAKVKDIAAAFRVISYCLLIVPFLSVERGYLQGHKLIALSSYSQVIEQLVRIVFVLASTYLIIGYYKINPNFGVLFALGGAGIGALAATLYLFGRKRNNSYLFVKDNLGEIVEKDRGILKKIFANCLVVIIVSISMSVYNIVDMKLILVGLHNLGYSAKEAQLISSIISNWAPKICMVVIALSMGMTGSIAPYISDSYVNRDYKGVRYKIYQALSILMIITVPITAGMIVFSEPLYNIFYGGSPYGDKILAMSLMLNAIGSIATVISMIMQSMGMGKIVCIANVVGIFLNAVFDLPLIYLFNYLGIPPYLGALASSIISQILIIVILAYDLKRHVKFKFSKMRGLVRGIALPLCAMLILIFVFRQIWMVEGNSRIYQVFQLAVYGSFSGLAYFFLSYKLGLLGAIEDMAFFQKIIRFLRLKK